MSAQQPPEPPAPVVRVVRGNPTPQETAVLVAVLTAAAAGPDSAAAAPQHSLWNARSRYARPALSAGPGAWRASMLPR